MPQPRQYLLDGLGCAVIAGLGQVGVDGRGGGRGVSQVNLDDTQMDSRFQQVGGPGVAQGMDGGWFVDAAFPECGMESSLHATGLHRTFLRLERRREEPDRIAVGEPVSAQHDQDGLRQRHIAILAPFAVADVQQVTVTINVGDLQMQSLLQTQPTGVDRAEADAVTLAAYTCQDTAYFVHTEHNWQFLLLGRTHEIKGLPFPAQGVLEEELDPAQGDGAGIASGVLFVL